MHAERGTWNGMTYALCRVCGDTATSDDWQRDKTRPDLWRCSRHKDRNPCVVDGCRRSRAANGLLSLRQTICGEHWRRYVPPGSPERRALQRLVRLAKKAGYSKLQRWPTALENRYWRVWYGIVQRVLRRSTAGHLDMTEINHLFGWDAD